MQEATVINHQYPYVSRAEETTLPWFPSLDNFWETQLMDSD